MPLRAGDRSAPAPLRERFERLFNMGDRLPSRHVPCAARGLRCGVPEAQRLAKPGKKTGRELDAAPGSRNDQDQIQLQLPNRPQRAWSSR